MLSEQLFLSGADSGAISLWGITKKKPLFELAAAHQSWVSAVGCVPFSDLCASASSDGVVKLWGLTSNYHLLCIQSLPVIGHINGLAFSKTGRFLACAVGQEPRLGRWSVIKPARNGIHLIPLLSQHSDTSASSQLLQ